MTLFTLSFMFVITVTGNGPVALLAASITAICFHQNQ